MIHILGVILIMAVITWLLNKYYLPEPPKGSDAEFLSLCCRRSGKNIEEIFRIAGERAGLKLADKWIHKDVRNFLHNDTDIPHYVKKFIDEGRKALDNDEENKSKES